jgi:TatD DNase family protein
MLIDFHTHLHSYNDIFQLKKCINENNILSIGCSIDIETYLQTKEMAIDSNMIIPTFGIHPLKSNTIKKLNQIDPYLNESAIIGEIGMDNYWHKDISLDVQEKVFEYIISYCWKYNKYCVIHTKGAEEQISNILLKYKNIKAVIHWYNGPMNIFKEFLARGYYFTFSCELHYSEYIKKLVSLTPIELILSETDNPTSEIWLGGNTDSPLLIQRVVDDIAKVKNIDSKSMESIIQNNCKKIFSESNIPNVLL